MPIDFQFEQARRQLAALVAAGEGLTLGSLAADLDLAPLEALTLLHRVVIQAHLPIRAQLDLQCPACRQEMEPLLGLAAWILAGGSYQVPCACGLTVAIEPNVLDLLLKPDTVPAETGDAGQRRHQIAERARHRVKTLDRESISAIQLSFDWGLNPNEPHA